MDFTVKKELEALAEDCSGATRENQPFDPDRAMEVIQEYWPFLRRSLTVIRLFTGPKGDVAIDKIIRAGDLLSADLETQKTN